MVNLYDKYSVLFDIEFNKQCYRSIKTTMLVAYHFRSTAEDNGFISGGMQQNLAKLE